MRVLFAGTPEVAVPSLDRLVADGFDVVAVLTREDAPVGRKRVLRPSPVAARAAELGLPVIRANRIDAAAREAIRAAGPDVAAIVAYGGLVPPAALGIPRHGWINLHFSLLPAWRGAAPVQHAVIHGDDITGAVTFLLEEGLDTGPVYGQLTEAIGPDDTAGGLLARLAQSGSVLLSQTLSGIDAGRLVAVPQAGEVSLAPKLGLEDGRVDWTVPALAVRRRINGTTPEPGAWTTLEGQRFKLGPVVPRTDTPALEPGHVAVLPGKRPRVLVGTGSHPVELGAVQPAGKKTMDASDWARGLGGETKVVFA
ncbi:methionyl-tRNA formyltransferase [Zafaria cholistanensis]|uniref:Methionyl-tRNA formyltransferase n=1 Tax=Zafaria cholistanensis TaxID=1682741 RepID=A0A5A7NUK5_9MICC|nr:methionyl-tRNA formyltransferase [Zafaria cholistanensis]GER23491.1 methionyl-tRNA formyltransferase [Zafaria cholistanensis]